MKRGKQNGSKLQAVLNVNEALSLKEDLCCQRVLSREQLLHVLQADNSCETACKGKNDKPNCLCGLIPAVGSVRRKGLWQKEPQGLQHLGANPADQKRQVFNSLLGLMQALQCPHDVCESSCCSFFMEHLKSLY